MPTTNAGRWAARLIAAAALLFALFFVLVAAGQRGGETFFSNPVLTVPFLGAALSAIAAGVVGIVAWWQHDRSPVVIATTIVGLLVLVWSVAELVFPH